MFQHKFSRCNNTNRNIYSLLFLCFSLITFIIVLGLQLDESLSVFISDSPKNYSQLDIMIEINNSCLTTTRTVKIETVGSLTLTNKLLRNFNLKWPMAANESESSLFHIIDTVIIR